MGSNRPGGAEQAPHLRGACGQGNVRRANRRGGRIRRPPGPIAFAEIASARLRGPRHDAVRNIVNHETSLRAGSRWFASGFLLMGFSAFGQTYYIALFAGHLKAAIGLSDGQFGSLYAVATLASAALLMWAGKLADRVAVRWLGAGALGGLALTALLMASATAAGWLALAMFGLRFFGQGMLPHVAMTAMARWFERRRGRAVAIATLGFPAGEALMPAFAVATTALLGWRLSWVAAAAVLLALALPLVIALLRREPVAAGAPAAANGQGTAASDLKRREWTRAEVARSPLFYALVPGVLAQPFIQTGVFFNQVTIVELKGWELAWFAASFPVMAGASVISALGAGALIDRFSARRLLPLLLLPLGAAILALALVQSAYVLPVFMGLVGLTHGSASTVSGALWAELYGTVHLGGIRALVIAGVVFASALSPGLIGILLDAGVAFELQLVVMAGFCFLTALWMAFLMPRLDRLAAGAGFAPVGGSRLQ